MAAIFKIVWSTGLLLLLYMAGQMYEIPSAIVPYYEWTLRSSFTSLACCLLWYPVSPFLRPKVLKMLDRLSRGIERLKPLLGGSSSGSDTSDGSESA